MTSSPSRGFGNCSPAARRHPAIAWSGRIPSTTISSRFDWLLLNDTHSLLRGFALRVFFLGAIGSDLDLEASRARFALRAGLGVGGRQSVIYTNTCARSIFFLLESGLQSSSRFIFSIVIYTLIHVRDLIFLGKKHTYVQVFKKFWLTFANFSNFERGWKNLIPKLKTLLPQQIHSMDRLNNG